MKSPPRPKWPKGNHPTKFRKELTALAPKIKTGRVLVIDPASQSCGYAILDKLKLVDSGTIVVKGSILKRLGLLYIELRDLGEFEVLVVERIRGARAHAYLKWSVGAIVAGAQAASMIEMPIAFWKAVIDKKTYEKTDENDAKAMAKVVQLLLAEHTDVEEEDSWI